MLFNSLAYAFFFPIVFIIYWFAGKKNLRLQNFILLVTSYYFYSFWDYRFVFLLLFSTVLDYITGIKIHEAKKQSSKKAWLWLSISINLGFLGVFKYYNFFATSLAEALSHIGFKADFWTLKVILPVGISFYTFHGISYVVDIYKNKIKPTLNFIDYAVFVSFFPLLVAGPIERATTLLPQIKVKRAFNYSKAMDGLRQVLWGLFKKIVIADNVAEYVNMIFKNSSSSYSGTTLLIGAILYTFQVYGDFSGYSDIALGSARLLGIELLRNFAYPFFSRDVAEFWRRWHISLTTWFRDYLYIPLGGSKGGNWMKVRNVSIIFLVSGFWHGANWTFIMWGALNAISFMPLLLLNRNREFVGDVVAQGKYLPSIKEVLNMMLTYSFIVFSWIYFRADNIKQANIFVKRMFAGFFNQSSYIETGKFLTEQLRYGVLIMMAVMIVIEWLGREQQYALAKLGFKWPKPIRLTFYYSIIFAILFWGGAKQQFIYFHF